MEEQLRREEEFDQIRMAGGVGDMKTGLNVKCGRTASQELGMKVEGLWDVLEPQQLSPTEKLNACFEEITVSDFPKTSITSVEIDSESSLAEAVRVLAKNKLLSAPVVDANAPSDSSWIDRYLGVVEFAGIVLWILQQAEADESLGKALETGGTEDDDKSSGGPALAAISGGTRLARLGSLSPRAAAVISGNFFGALTSSEFYKNAKVRDVAGGFRWAPFLALQTSNSMLTVLLLLSKYKMKSVPVVEPGEAQIVNIITQSAVIHMLAECAGQHWFESLGNKELSELGLPATGVKQIIKVYGDEPVLQAFKEMRLKGIGGLPVLERESGKPIGNISIRDVQFLLMAPDIYQDYRSITAKDFLVAARRYREQHGEVLPTASGFQLITCKKNTTLKEAIQILDSKKIHRVYVVDDEGELEGIVTLRDIISRMVHEPKGYFGDFFDGHSPNWKTTT